MNTRPWKFWVAVAASPLMAPAAVLGACAFLCTAVAAPVFAKEPDVWIERAAVSFEGVLGWWFEWLFEDLA